MSGSTVTSYIRKKFKQQERSAAQDIGGRCQPGSGSVESAKGDVRKAGELRVECKTTGGNSFALKHSELLKIEREAQEALEDWVFQFQFQKQSGMARKFAVCTFQTFLGMLGKDVTPERLIVKDYPILKKQVALPLSELISRFRHEATPNAAIVFEICFGEQKKFRRYAVMSWEFYMELRASQGT